MDATTTRRRSQRLFLQVRVLVEGTAPDHSTFSEETHAIVINAHGALVELGVALEPGQMVTLRNIRTLENAECKIKLVTPAGSGKFSTALEFSIPNPDFWRISFPPDDWTVRNLDPTPPKKNG